MVQSRPTVLNHSARRLPLADGVRYLREQKCEVFLELGPGETLLRREASACQSRRNFGYRHFAKGRTNGGNSWRPLGRFTCGESRSTGLHSTAITRGASYRYRPTRFRASGTGSNHPNSCRRNPACPHPRAWTGSHFRRGAHHDLPACTRWRTIGTSQPRLRRPFLGDRAALMAFSTTAESELVARPKTGAADAKRGVSIAQ